MIALRHGQRRRSLTQSRRGSDWSPGSTAERVDGALLQKAAPKKFLLSFIFVLVNLCGQVHGGAQ